MNVESIEGLSKESVSYLRRADDVYALVRDGQCFLAAVKRGRFDDAFSEDRRVEIAVEGAGADGWFTAAWEFPWQTLRAGQRVRLEWYPDAGTNEYAREAGLHIDKLYVHVGSGQKWARYLVSSCACPDNSARMCKSV